MNHDLKKAAEKVKETNAVVADLLLINRAARTTCVKPAGTTSLTLGTSSGIHAWHAPHYIRRIRVKKIEPIYQYLKIMHPELIEQNDMDPDGAIIAVPQKAPENAIMRTESALDLLTRVKKFSTEWVKTGHLSGINTHNVSATVSIKDHEWDEVREWMWENRDSYNGLSVLQHDGGQYNQAPFEDCTEERYEELMKSLTEVNLDHIHEEEDKTDLSGEIACAGGACEIDFSYEGQEPEIEDTLKAADLIDQPIHETRISGPEVEDAVKTPTPQES
jgi:ribonucleoside-triphosphate reductase